MNTYLTTLMAAIVCCAVVQTAPAALLNSAGTSPVIAYSSGSAVAVNYTASTGAFSVSGNPSLANFGSGAPSIVTGAKSLSIQLVVNSAGALVSGTAGDDLVVMGTVTRIFSGVTNVYTDGSSRVRFRLLDFRKMARPTFMIFGFS